jgi:hypothetical protein
MNTDNKLELSEFNTRFNEIMNKIHELKNSTVKDDQKLKELYKIHKSLKDEAYKKRYFLDDDLIWKLKTDCTHPKVWYGLFGERVICDNCDEYIDPSEVTENTIIEHENVDEDEWYWEEVSFEDFKSYFRSKGLLK